MKKEEKEVTHGSGLSSQWLTDLQVCRREVCSWTLCTVLIKETRLKDWSILLMLLIAVISLL